MPRWLQRLLPGSMASLVAIACLLAATPLLLALALAVSELKRLSYHDELLVDEGLAVVQLGSQLQDDAAGLERSTRQYIALRDPALLNLVDRRILETRRTLQLLQAQHLPALAPPVAEAAATLAALEQQWSGGLRQKPALEAAAARARTLAADADRILGSGHRSIDAQITELRRASMSARIVTLVSTLALLPLTALLALAASVLVTRPLRRIALAIAELGRGGYHEPVAIGFPAEMRRLGKRLDWLRRRLYELEADKERFLRTVLHELKTPLASLMAGSGLLQEGRLGPLSVRQQEVLTIVADSGAELCSQLDNLLGYARWRRERRGAPMQWFDVRPLIADAIARQKLLLQARGVRTELVLRSARLCGHPAQLRVAVGNLLSNAIRHAPPGSTIEIETTVREGRCELGVRDYGHGVPEADRRRIFEPFEQGDGETDAGGSGVGLSIVQEAVLTHRGIVEVEDAQPGARFKLAWPCIPQRPAA